MKISQNSLTLSYFLILIKTILFLTITSLSFANEKKIGSVTELKGTIVAITEELDERDNWTNISYDELDERINSNKV